MEYQSLCLPSPTIPGGSSQGPLQPLKTVQYNWGEVIQKTRNFGLIQSWVSIWEGGTEILKKKWSDTMVIGEGHVFKHQKTNILRIVHRKRKPI